MFAFVDESARPGRYLMASVRVMPSFAGIVRRGLTDLVLPGQRRLHFKTESDRRRRMLLSAMAQLPVAIDLYIARGLGGDVARGLCLQQIVRDLQATGDDTIVFIERVDGLETYDHRSISAARHRSPNLTWQHLAPTEDPILWLADAAAWATGAGEDWHDRLGATISRLVEITA